MQDNGGRRSGFDQRDFMYTIYLPEKRSGKERRYDRRKCLERRTGSERRQVQDDIIEDRRSGGQRRSGMERRAAFIDKPSTGTVFGDIG